MGAKTESKSISLSGDDWAFVEARAKELGFVDLEKKDSKGITKYFRTLLELDKAKRLQLYAHLRTHRFQFFEEPEQDAYDASPPAIDPSHLHGAGPAAAISISA